MRTEIKIVWTCEYEMYGMWLHHKGVVICCLSPVLEEVEVSRRNSRGGNLTEHDISFILLTIGGGFNRTKQLYKAIHQNNMFF